MKKNKICVGVCMSSLLLVVCLQLGKRSKMNVGSIPHGDRGQVCVSMCDMTEIIRMEVIV